MSKNGHTNMMRYPEPLNIPVYAHCQQCGRKLKEPKARGFFQPWVQCAHCQRKEKL